MRRILKKVKLPFFIKKKIISIYIQLLKGLYFQFLQHGGEEGHNTRSKAVKGPSQRPALFALYQDTYSLAIWCKGAEHGKGNLIYNNEKINQTIVTLTTVNNPPTENRKESVCLSV